MKNFCLHDKTANPTIHGVKPPPAYNTSYIPVPSVDCVHSHNPHRRIQHQHSADSAGSASDSVTWPDTARLTNHRAPAATGGGAAAAPARTGILKFATTNRRSLDGSRTLPQKSGSLDSGIQGGPMENNRQHIPVPNTFQGPYHGNIDKQPGSSQSLNITSQPYYTQGHPGPNRNSSYTSRTLSPSHKQAFSSSLQAAPNSLPSPTSNTPMDNKCRSPKMVPGANNNSNKVHPSKGLYDHAVRYGGVKANSDWGSESVLSDDGTCASTTSGSYMVEADGPGQDAGARSSFRDDKEALTQQTMV